MSVVFVLDHLTDNSVKSSDTNEGSDEEEGSAAQLRLALRTAVWMVSISVSLPVFAQTLIALLNRSMDPLGTLKQVTLDRLHDLIPSELPDIL